MVDSDTHIVNWSGSVGLGGRGLIPTREEDIFGVGFVFTKFNEDRRLVQVLANEEAYGIETFYNFAIAPGVSLTGDIQVIEPAARFVDTTVVLGVRLNIRF
ncbi:MAG: carbohydrate porin [Deltaproteobacteria bacterium]|nr:carbohydrate porin [Deltaproteobacteria bacterium]